MKDLSEAEKKIRHDIETTKTWTKEDNLGKKEHSKQIPWRNRKEKRKIMNEKTEEIEKYKENSNLIGQNIRQLQLKDKKKMFVHAEMRKCQVRKNK